MAKRKSAMADYMKPKKVSGGRSLVGKPLPTLSDLKVPKKGLLDPSLRKDMGKIKGLS